MVRQPDWAVRAAFPAAREAVLGENAMRFSFAFAPAPAKSEKSMVNTALERTPIGRLSIRTGESPWVATGTA
jgi:hypothetical protein